MSVAASRAAIVAALATVDGVSATGHTPPTVTAGAAWVVLASAVPRGGCFTEGTWYAFLAVPAANSAATVAAGDAFIDAVLAALYGKAKVTAVEPWSWPLEPGAAAAPAIRFTLEV